MNIQLNAFWTISVTLILSQSGCTSHFGHRYHEGADLACPECEQGAQLAGESSVVAPHSRFHPVPTRPVFSPQPTAGTVTVATHSVLSTPQNDARQDEKKKPAPRSVRVAGAPIAAPQAADLQTARAIDRWATETEQSIPGKQVASGASSRRVVADEPDHAPATLPADDRDVVNGASLPQPAPIQPPAAWTDRFNTGDGWRPRVAR